MTRSDRVWLIIIGFLVLVVLLGMTGCGDGDETAVPTPPTAANDVATAPAAPLESEQPAAGAWDRIQSSGVIVAGTSADYPPFAFYTPTHELSGYDIAVMRALAQQLGLQVEFRDLAFSGLAGALQLGQIDVAIAALTVTAERAAVIDFTNVYFVGSDAVLGRSDGRYQLQHPEDLANYRVGVQAGSVYEAWLRSNLVEPGLMPQSNLFIYTEAAQGLRDLELNRLDLVVADLQPAQLAANASPDLTIVAEGLNRQRYAIAVPKGATQLQNALNEALAQLQNRGRLAALAETYLNVAAEDVLPPEPEPTPPPATPPAACIDGMALVQHLSFDDQNMTAPPRLNPGEAFRKAWRVRNIGTCTWDTGYALRFVTGADMGGTAVTVQTDIPPGATYDFSVTLTAPTTPGTYQGVWEMVNSAGDAFGERLTVGVSVPVPPTAAPVPTETGAPSINSFTVNRSQIRAGECVTFSWDVRNVTAVYFFPQGVPNDANPVPAQASRTECPPTTTNYFLRVVNPDGSVQTRQITIFVTANTLAPIIESFTVTPGFQINAGQCVIVAWQVSGDVTDITLRRNELSLRESLLSGSLQDCPPAGIMAYSIEARGPGGTSRGKVNLTVVAPTPRSDS